MMSQQTSIPSQYTNYYDYEGLLEMGSGQAFSSDLQPDKNYFFVDQTPYEGPWGEPMDLDEPEQMTLNIEILEGNRVSSERHMKPTASYGGGNKKIRKRKDKSGRKGKPVRVISNQQGSNSRTAGGKELVFEDQEIGFEMDQGYG